MNTYGRYIKVLAIYCMPDHVHILVGLRPYMALADLVQVLKKESTNFINEKKFVAGRFSWQEGYGFFSHSHSELDKVIQYIFNCRANTISPTCDQKLIDNQINNHETNTYFLSPLVVK